MASKPQPRATLRTRLVAFAMAGASAVALGQAAPAPSTSSPAPATSPASASQTTGSPAAPSPPAPSKRQKEEAESAYLAGARLLDRNDLAGAEKQFNKAAKLNPENPDYREAAALALEHRVTELVQQAGKARMLGQKQKSEQLLAEAHTLDPQNNIVAQHMGTGVPSPITFTPEIEPWIQKGPAIAGPITLLPSSDKSSFHVRGDIRDVVQQVMKAYGIKASFDDSVERQNVRLDLDGTTYEQASKAVLELTHLFAVPLNPQSVLVIKDTTENRQRFERQLQETIYVPGMTKEQMTELTNMVRTVFDIKQVSVENGAGLLLIRAPEETLTAVNLTLADLIDGGAEVMLDIDLYTVDRSLQRNVGTQLPQQIGIYSVAGEAENLVNSNQSLVNQAIAQGLIPANASPITIALALIASGLVQSSLLSNTIGFFGGGLTMTGVTANASTTFQLALNSSDTRALDNVRLRVGDKQTGTFRVGMHYPIITSTYTSGISGTASQLAGVTINGVSASSLLSQNSSVTIPQIQYEDLGLTVKVKPTVQKSGMVEMQLDLKIEALTGTSANNIPVLANTQYISDVTVRDGETSLLASSLTKQQSAAISGLPGLGELPGFQTLTADKLSTTDSSDLVLLITPHIVRRRSNVIAGPRIALNLPETD